MYFLENPTDREVTPDWEASLVIVKVSDTERAYLAAPTVELAGRLRDMINSADVRVIAGAELSSRHYRDFGTTRILLIDSTATLEHFMATRGTTFPYEQHLVSHSERADN